MKVQELIDLLSGLNRGAEVHLFNREAKQDEDVYLHITGVHYATDSHVSVSCQPRQLASPAESAEGKGEQPQKTNSITNRP